MSQLDDTSRQFEHYISGLFAPEDEALRAAREEMEREKLPQINVSASQGKLLQLLALLAKARRILEIGTLGGYSAIWLARALPADGRLVSLEIDVHHAEVSRRNLERAGFSRVVEVRVGPALESLQHMQVAGEEPFDLVFVDADKESYPQYLQASLPLTRDGGLILADNTLSRAVLDPQADNGIMRFNAAAAAHPELDSIIVPVVRDRGIDGLLISVKRANPRAYL